MTATAAMGGMEWTIEATLRSKDGAVQHGASFKIRWADSWVCNSHSSHLGDCIQLALMDAKQHAFPRWKRKKARS